MHRLLISVFVSCLMVFLLASGCGVLTDAFSCDDEEERLNKADANYDRNWNLYINGQLTAAQWSDIANERAEASIAYRSCKDN